MSVGLIIANWTGFQGAPGVSVLAARVLAGADYQAAVDAVRAFFNAQSGSLPDDVTISVDPTVDTFNEVDGALEATFTAGTPPAPVLGVGTGTYSAPTGYSVEWPTAGTTNNRRVRGRTFIVPATSTSFDVSGSVHQNTRDAGGTAGGTLIASMGLANLPLAIWTRPRKASTDPPVTARVGSLHDVVDAVVDAPAAILSSRRD